MNTGFYIRLEGIEFGTKGLAYDALNLFWNPTLNDGLRHWLFESVLKQNLEYTKKKLIHTL